MFGYTRSVSFEIQMFSYFELLQLSSSHCSSKFWLICLLFLVVSIVSFVMDISCRHLVTIVKSESMRPSFRRGDILLSTSVKTSSKPNVKVGDVVLVQVSIDNKIIA